MEIEALELFAELMRTRSFTDIAHARGIAPSSVSRTIAGLEKELGIRLFQRSTRKLEPTEAGVTYFERIEPLLAELQSARLMAADLDAQPRGVLRVTTGVVYGEMYIAPLLPELAERYPSLTIELILTDATLDLIEERIDVAIRTGTLRDSNYVARRLKDMTFYLCAAQTYLNRHGKPTDPEEVMSHNCLLFPRVGYTTTKWLFRNRSGNIREIPIRGNCLITNSRAIKECAMAGMGLALLPDWLVGAEVEAGSLIRLFDNHEVTPTDYEGAVWMLSPSREYVPLKTRVFTEYLLKKFQAT